jgi:hypothetical protein
MLRVTLLISSWIWLITQGVFFYRFVATVLDASIFGSLMAMYLVMTFVMTMNLDKIAQILDNSF